jgi:hypothetical protein
MARKKVREYSAKALLKKHLKELRGIELPTDAAQVAPLPANTPSPPQFKDQDAFVRSFSSLVSWNIPSLVYA